jgi:hypothetical protein
MYCNSDTKNAECNTKECMCCGYYERTNVGKYNLKEVNELRGYVGLKKIKKLWKQD